MADNVTLPGTGAVIATDEATDGTLGTVQFQYVKLVDGTLGSTTKVGAGANGLKVDGSSVTQPVSGTVTATLSSTTNAGSTAKTSDYDTGAGTDTVAMLGIALPASGGAVQGGTSTNPLQVSIANTGANATAVKVDASGAAVPVTGTFWQSTQPVSGTVTVQQSTAASLKVDLSGTAANSTAIKVDNSAVTQPVSAASLPLPAGAATSAKQPALGTAGTPSADVVTVQGATSMTALKVDGSGTTQPVSGTVTVQQSTAANLKVDLSGTAANTTAIKVDGSASTQPVSLASVPTHAVTQSGTWTVQPGNTANTTAWKVDGSSVTQPVSGTVTATLSGTSNAGATAKTSDYDTGAGIDTVTMMGLALPASGGAVAGGTTTNPIRTDPTGTTTQPISGTVTANAGTGTMAVSAASLPLPAGASTSAKQPALGTAGSASADVLTVQGIASMTPLKVDGSGVTQPVSGSVTVSGTVTSNAGTGTMAVSAASLPLPSGAATSAKQPALGTAGTASSDVLSVQGVASMTALKVDGSAVTQPVSGTFWQATQPVSGTVTVQQSTASSLKVDLSGTAANTVALKVDGSAVTQPVSLASVPTHAVTQSGAWTVTQTPATSGGCSCSSSNASALTVVKGSAGQLYGYSIGNAGASALYIQMFNAATTGAVTLGTTAPLYQDWVPAGGGRNYSFDSAIAFATGIVIAITTTRTGSTAPSTAADWNIIYK